jgi:hypothetical protein
LNYFRRGASPSTDKNLECIRAANRAREKEYQSTEKNPLITELDNLVMNMIQWNAENDI